MAVDIRYTGTYLQYVYDRDRSLTGSLTATTLTDPTYGSEISFDTVTNQIIGQNNYKVSLPNSVNNVKAEISLQFQNLTEAEASPLLVFFETIGNQTGSGQGYFNIGYGNNVQANATYGGTGFNMALGTGNYAAIYSPISGCYLIETIHQHEENDKHDITARAKIDRLSTTLNWSGVFANTAYIQTWDSGVAYEKYDIVYYNLFENKRNNFFYCTESYTGSNTAPNLLNNWTQSFFWEPDFSVNIQQNKENQFIEIKNSYSDRIKTNKNSNLLNLELTFSNRANKEAWSLLHFLENKAGYIKFPYEISKIYKSKKVFSSPKWNHKYNWDGSNTIKVSLVEEAIPIFSKTLA